MAREGYQLKSVGLWKTKLMIMVFTTTFRVRWVDTDCAGVMCFTNFFRYVAACEEEFYRSVGMTVNTIREKYGLMLPRAEVHCQFKAACRFDDLVEVTLRVREVADKSITYDFQLFRKQEGQLAAEGYIKCIAVDSNWKVVKIPSDVAKAIREHA